MKRVIIVGLSALFAVSTASAAQKFESKVEPGVKASGVDFAKELGSDSPSVRSLGYLIETARTEADPIGLAVLSNELAAVEKATGKMADIKAADLATEAAKLARQRGHATELKAVAVLLPDQAAELDKAAEAAAKAEAIAKKNKGSDSKGVNGILHIDSHAIEPLDAYVNGTYVGRVGPGGDLYVSVGGPGNTILFARGVFSGGTCAEEITEVVGNFTWTLHD